MAGLRVYSEEELAFLRQVPDLPDDLSLSPEQASVLVGESLEWLRKKRQGSEGAGPPFEQHGEEASVRYPLGAVRKWKQARTFSTTREAKEAKLYGRLCSFLGGSLSGGETFRDGPEGSPVLCSPSDEGSYNLSLDGFLERVRDEARRRHLADEASILDGDALPGGPAVEKTI